MKFWIFLQKSFDVGKKGPKCISHKSFTVSYFCILNTDCIIRQRLHSRWVKYAKTFSLKVSLFSLSLISSFVNNAFVLPRLPADAPLIFSHRVHVCVCARLCEHDIKCEMGAIIQSLLTGPSPCEATLLPPPIYPLHRLCLWAQTPCMRDQSGVQLCKDTRDKETYIHLRGDSRPFFPLAASPGWRVSDEQPEALEFNCVNSLSCIISGFLRWFETTHLKFPIMCAIALFKCHRQHVCQGPWTDVLHY